MFRTANLSHDKNRGPSQPSPPLPQPPNRRRQVHPWRSGHHRAPGSARLVARLVRPHVLSSDQFLVGTTQVQNDAMARKRLGIPQDRPVTGDQIFRLVYRSLQEAARGQSRGPALYEQVEGPELEATNAAVDDIYYGRFTINPHQPFDAALWQDALTSTADILGMNVKDQRKLDAVRALIAASNVNDRSGRPNIERIELMLFMIERLLRERQDDMSVKGWRMGLNLTAIAGTIRTLDERVETVNRVAVQAFMSNPLTGTPGNVVRQNNAVQFWRDHARELRGCVIRPYGNWFTAMATILDRSADAMEQGGVNLVKINMILLQAVCAVARTRAAVERVLVPVAEMHKIDQRRRQVEPSPAREFGIAMVARESTNLFYRWNGKNGLGTEAAPLSQGDSVEKVRDALAAASTFLKESDINGAYDALKKAVALLERPIRIN